MPTRINLVLMLTALLCGCYFTWRIVQPELVGHWHVSQTLGTDDNGMKGIHHFNVYANGEIRVNEVNDGDYVLPGYIDKLSRQLHFGGECWYVGADYMAWGRRLELSSGDYARDPWRAVAHRTKRGDCDPERDYFAGMPVSIRLPVAAGDQLEPLPNDLYKTHTFYLGEEQGGGPVRLLAHRNWDIQTAEDLRDMLRRSAERAWVLGDEPSQIVLFQDAEVDAEEKLALLAAVFGEAGFDGYYWVYRRLDGDERLNLGCLWVGF